ncbi:hypothetical protein B0H10DRAFT_2216995 [Mycena sp. CBHHK59/15]|nr:hypothetical protein B0H10DRAFT_2216995 [Mycena sp. CBHHK59/15]
MLHRLKNLLGFGPSPPDISLSPTPSIPPRIGPPPLPGNKPLPPALVVTGAAFPQYTGMHTNPAQTGPNLNTAISQHPAFHMAYNPPPWTPFWPPNPGSVPLSHVPAHMPAYFQPYPYFPPPQQILQPSSPAILPTQMQQSGQSLSVQNGSSNPQTQLPLATAQSNMPFPTINPPTLIDSPSYQWPDGNVMLECTFGLEPSGWDDEGWKWRSSGSRKTGVQEGTLTTRKHVKRFDTTLGGTDMQGPPFRSSRNTNSKHLIFKFAKILRLRNNSVRAQYICMQTPFMRDALLRDSVQSWHDENLEAESGHHGVLTDGTHDFFNQGILLTSLVFSHVVLRWVAVLYTWIGKQNEEHHVPHFSQLVHGIGEACTRGLGYTFDDRLFSAILDFSNAQRDGFIEAFVEHPSGRVYDLGHRPF